MFRLYTNGLKFLEENRPILQREPLQTAFFVSNAQQMPEIRNSAQGFIAKVEQQGQALLAIRRRHYPMVLYGEPSLCGEMAQGLLEHGLTFRQMLAGKELADMFLVCYLSREGGDFRLLRCLQLMRWGGKDPALIPPDCSQPAQPQDKDALIDLVAQFHRDALGEMPNLEELEAKIERELPQYRLIRQQGRAVSIGKKARDQQDICAISNVYTQIRFRNQGLARQVVAGLTRQILLEGKLPYLYADLRNLTADRLYRDTGYVLDSIQMEFLYKPDLWKHNL